ncbi:unnamed protein product [Plutella xylostella]|uniref:ascorbate ferrireductase (transmembrane) n=1 Tax=Plutella xylostella TaxID=51655 RepID=A0A8S4DH75_PLUXY|nr:unnamed protein product [Plutella xylostella]
MTSHVDKPNQSDPEAFTSTGPVDNGAKTGKQSEGDYRLQIFQSSLNALAHILIGATVMPCLLYALRNGVPLTATSVHIILCVIGHHLLMAEAILSLSPANGWSSRLRLVDKRRAHWILMTTGSGMAIAGSFYKILDKPVHWNTLHGQFALVALVFTVASLFNGLTSHYAYEWRVVFNANLSKITHICFGVLAYTMSSVCLIYGLDKQGVRNWATSPVIDALIAAIVIYTAICIINPTISFYRKSKLVVKNSL